MNAAWQTGDVTGMVADLRQFAAENAVGSVDESLVMRIQAIAWVEGVIASDVIATSAKVQLTGAVLEALRSALDGAR